jgi:arsenate reductase
MEMKVVPLCGPDKISGVLRMPKPAYNVLFLCTSNSARSILAESILRVEGAGRFQAFSAGSHPKSAVNPLALDLLDRLGYPTAGLRSKSWLEFEGPNAPLMDFIFTVCDNAAGEVCPLWPGQPTTAHWGIEDPAAVRGTDMQRQAAFAMAARYLKNRIVAFSSLPIDRLDQVALRAQLGDIGRKEGTIPIATLDDRPENRRLEDRKHGWSGHYR